MSKTETPHETAAELGLCLEMQRRARTHTLSPICCGEAVRGRQDVMHHVCIKHPAMPGIPTLVFLASSVCQPRCFLCRCHRSLLAGERRLGGLFLRCDSPRFPCLSLPLSCCKALGGWVGGGEVNTSRKKHESVDKLAGVCALLILALTP